MAPPLGRMWGFWILLGALAGCGPALPAAGSDYVRSASSGYVLADPAPGMIVRIGSTPLLNKGDAAAASEPGSAALARLPGPR